MTSQRDEFLLAPQDTGDPADALLAIAADHASAERWSEAASAYREALDIAPDRAEAAFGLGVVCEFDGQHGPALQHLALAAELAPDNALYWRLLGLALRGAGELDASLAAFEASLECDPGEEQAFLHVVEGRFLLGRFSEVVASAGAMPLLRARHPLLTILQASSLLALGQPEGARDAVSRGIFLFPDDAELRAFAQAVRLGDSAQAARGQGTEAADR